MRTNQCGYIAQPQSQAQLLNQRHDFQIRRSASEPAHELQPSNRATAINLAISTATTKQNQSCLNQCNDTNNIQSDDYDCLPKISTIKVRMRSNFEHLHAMVHIHRGSGFYFSSVSSSYASKIQLNSYHVAGHERIKNWPRLSINQNPYKKNTHARTRKHNIFYTTQFCLLGNFVLSLFYVIYLPLSHSLNSCGAVVYTFFLKHIRWLTFVGIRWITHNHSHWLKLYPSFVLVSEMIQLFKFQRQPA